MASNIILIIGGASFDFEIKSLFDKYNLYIEHYDARKSQSLKKQNIPKNTIGVIITVDRSHMTFGDSNELTRLLKNNNIPFVFSTGNLASYNSAKVLIQKINKVYPNEITIKENIPENDKKLDTSKQEWKKLDNIYSNKLNNLFEIEYNWENKLNEWNKILEHWKIYILEWKEIQNSDKHKTLKKKLNKEYSYLSHWKQELHDYGLKIERNITLVKNWKESIDDLTLEAMSEHEKLKLIITELNNINQRKDKNIFKVWKSDFELFKENIDLWEKQYQEWFNIYPQAFIKIFEWEKSVHSWFEALNKKLNNTKKK